MKFREIWVNATIPDLLADRPPDLGGHEEPFLVHAAGPAHHGQQPGFQADGRPQRNPFEPARSPDGCRLVRAEIQVA